MASYVEMEKSMGKWRPVCHNCGEPNLRYLEQESQGFILCQCQRCMEFHLADELTYRVNSSGYIALVWDQDNQPEPIFPLGSVQKEVKATSTHYGRPPSAESPVGATHFYRIKRMFPGPIMIPACGYPGSTSAHRDFVDCPICLAQSPYPGKLRED